MKALARYVGRYQLGPDFVFSPNMVGELPRTEEGLVIVSGGGGGTSYLRTWRWTCHCSKSPLVATDTE